jgi:glycosyltransferase involved in cell wall biosynthesis
MQKLIEDHSLKEILKTKGLERAQKFSWKEMSKQYQELYLKTFNSKQ